jgi:hypothetical protein
MATTNNRLSAILRYARVPLEEQNRSTKRTSKILLAVAFDHTSAEQAKA